MAKFKANFCVVFLMQLAVCKSLESKVEFVIYNNGRTSISTFNTSISEQGCDVQGKFAIFTHGWIGSSNIWIYDMLSNLTHYRSGCVIFMNYSYYSDRDNYLECVSLYKIVSRVLTRKLKQLRDGGVKADQIYMFGYSLGARVVIEAALNFGINQVGQIDRKLKFK